MSDGSWLKVHLTCANGHVYAGRMRRTLDRVRDEAGAVKVEPVTVFQPDHCAICRRPTVGVEG